MGTHLILAVRDNKVGAYLRPFVDHNEVQAIRGLTRVVQTPDNQIAQFPADFDLYQIGTFDDNSGEITPLIPPRFITSALSCLPQPKGA